MKELQRYVAAYYGTLLPDDKGDLVKYTEVNKFVIENYVPLTQYDRKVDAIRQKEWELSLCQNANKDREQS